MKLRFYNATIKGAEWNPTEESGGNHILELTAPLKRKLAEKLACDEMCFTRDGHPRRFDGSITLALELDKASVELGDHIYESKVIKKFKIGRKETAADSDITLHVTVRMHFDGNYSGIPEFCRQTNKGEFSFCIEPGQGTLDFTGEDTEEEEVSGKSAAPKTSGTLASRQTMAGGKSADLKKKSNGAEASA